jgi:hypothetical protein
MQEIHLIKRNKHWLKVTGWKIYQANGPWKHAEAPILISDKVDFKHTLVKQNKEGHLMLIKGAIHQKEIIINLYVPKVSTPNFIIHTLKYLKAHIGIHSVVLEEFNTVSPKDRLSKQKINKEILELNYTIIKWT